MRVTDMTIKAVDYQTAEGLCRGSNLIYRVDGRQCSARVPWIATNPAAEAMRLERRLAEVRKRGSFRRG